METTKRQSSVVAVDEGKVYTIRTHGGKLINLVFCHNAIDPVTQVKEFQDGITSEDLIEILVRRHKGFCNLSETTENLNIYTLLKQVQIQMDVRRREKYKRKHRNKQA
jgi:hypothetical protein